MEIELPLIRSDFDSRNKASYGYKVLLTLLIIPVALLFSFAGVPEFIAAMAAWIASMLVFRTLRRSRKDWVGEKDIVGKLLIDERSVRLVSASATIVFQISDLAQLDINHNHIQGRSTGYRGPVMNGILTIELLTR